MQSQTSKSVEFGVNAAASGLAVVVPPDNALAGNFPENALVGNGFDLRKNSNLKPLSNGNGTTNINGTTAVNGTANNKPLDESVASSQHRLWRTKVAKPVLGVKVADRANGVDEVERSTASNTSIGRTVRAYVALTKPRVIEQLLITTVPAMVLAQRGWPNTWLVVATIVGGALAAGAANTANMVYDRDIDSKMDRTKGRPLVTGEITPKDAVVFAIAMQLASFAILSAAANLLAASLTLGASAFYVLVYTMWLKRKSTQNIVIGGAAGAAPALVGWAAVTDSLSWSAVILFSIVFFWTPPHFWALAVRYKDDYAKANVPMLPVVKGITRATREMFLYALMSVALTLLLVPVADLGFIYSVVAGVSGGAFALMTLRVVSSPTTSRAMKLFGYSITYLTLVCVGLIIDQLV